MSDRLQRLHNLDAKTLQMWYSMSILSHHHNQGYPSRDCDWNLKELADEVSERLQRLQDLLE